MKAGLGNVYTFRLPGGGYGAAQVVSLNAPGRRDGEFAGLDDVILAALDNASLFPTIWHVSFPDRWVEAIVPWWASYVGTEPPRERRHRGAAGRDFQHRHAGAASHRSKLGLARCRIARGGASFCAIPAAPASGTRPISCGAVWKPSMTMCGCRWALRGLRPCIRRAGRCSRRVSGWAKAPPRRRPRPFRRSSSTGLDLIVQTRGRVE